MNGICEMAWVTGDTESKLQDLMEMPAGEMKKQQKYMYIKNPIGQIRKKRFTIHDC